MPKPMTVKLQSEAFKRDPYPAFKRLLAEGPMARMKMPIIGPVATCVSHAANLEMLKDKDRFVVDGRNAGKRSALGIPFMPKTLQLLATNMLTQDDPEHRRLRQLSDAPFRRANIVSLRPLLESKISQLLDSMEAEGNADIVTGLARPLPIQIISDLLGLSAEGRPGLEATLNGFAAGGSRLAVAQILFKLGGMRRAMMAEIQLARSGDGDGLLRELVLAETEQGGLTDDELFSMSFLLYAAGHETTTQFISSAVYTLLTVPGAWGALKDAGEVGIGSATDELMRYCGPVQITKPRFAAEDMTFHGVDIKKGERVMALLAAGNFDADVFEDPFTLNLTRRPNRHLGWGGGAHLCLGLHLAKLEVECVLLELMRRYPDLAIEGAPEHLRWIKRLGVRGLLELPLKLRP